MAEFNWNPAEDFLCRDWPTWTAGEDVCFPGGFCLSQIVDAINQAPSPAQIIMQYFEQLGPVMAPLKPIFDIIDAVLAVYKCVKATGDAIAELDPTKIFDCIPELVEIINNLLNMIPQMSLPRMIQKILRTMASLLRGIATDLLYLVDKLEDIAAAIDRAADLNDVTLSGFLACSQATIQDQAFGMADVLAGIGRIILLVNILMGLFGGPEIPCFGALVKDALPGPLQPIIDVLNLLADLLDYIANLIPDPQLALTLALGDLKC